MLTYISLARYRVIACMQYVSVRMCACVTVFLCVFVCVLNECVYVCVLLLLLLLLLLLC